MKIYSKTIITLGIVFIFLFSLTAAVTSYVFMTHTEQVENDVLKDNALRVQRAFSNEISHMDNNLYDWSAWDATYQYIQDNNSEYLNSNIQQIDIFLTLNINFMLFYDNNGNLVYGKAVDLTEEKEIPIPTDLDEHFNIDSILLDHPSIDSASSGIIMLEDSFVIVVSRPIIKSDYTGPIAGTMVTGRFLDDSFIAQIEEQTLLPITIQALDSSNLPLSFGLIKEQVLKENYATNINNENNIVSAYFLIEDIYGKPAIIMKTEMPRLIYKEGLAAISLTFYMTLLISVTFALLLSFLLKKNLLSRITSLRNGIQAIDLKADINSRIYMNGNDELSELANNINSMLDSLQEKNAIFQSTIESVAYGLIAVDNEDRVLFMNPEYRHMFKLPPEMESEKDGTKILKIALQKAQKPDELSNRINENKLSFDANKTFVKLIDGRTIQAYSLPLVINDRISGRLYAHSDITEILAHEKELRKEIDRREEAEERKQKRNYCLVKKNSQRLQLPPTMQL